MFCWHKWNKWSKYGKEVAVHNEFCGHVSTLPIKRYQDYIQTCKKCGKVKIDRIKL